MDIFSKQQGRFSLIFKNNVTNGSTCVDDDDDMR